MTEKRYYWLKLKDDFFAQKEIKKLRKIAGGDTYTIIYLKLQLLSLKNEGAIIFEGVEDSFIDEMALALDEDAENVRVTILYLQKVGFIEEISSDEFLLPKAVESIGSETTVAARVRKHREGQKLLQCNALVTKGNTEIEIEKDVETERDTETEYIYADEPAIVASEKPSWKLEVQEIFDYYTYVFKGLYTRLTLTDKRKSHIKARLTEGYTVEQIKHAISNIRTSSFHCGENDKGMVYAQIEFICRNAETLERWINHNPKPPGGNKNTAKAIELYNQAKAEEEGEPVW